MGLSYQAHFMRWAQSSMDTKCLLVPWTMNSGQCRLHCLGALTQDEKWHRFGELIYVVG